MAARRASGKKKRTQTSAGAGRKQTSSRSPAPSKPPAKRTSSGARKPGEGPKRGGKPARTPAPPPVEGRADALTAQEIATILQQIAALLEITGANPFKVRAYENAARVLPGLGEDLPQLIERGDLEKVRGIGSGIAQKVESLARSARLEYYEELKAQVPEGLLEMLRVPGLGPKKIKLLFDELDIVGIEALEEACRENRLAGLRGFGTKTQENILTGIEHYRRIHTRFLWGVASRHAEAVFEALRKHPAVERAEMAGSLRRRRETVKDVDIVVSTRKPEEVSRCFAEGPWTDRVLGSGTTKTSIVHSSGLQIDLRVVSDAQYPYALHHFTGSKAHNVAMRARAQRMGFKINEYGLFRGNELVVCKSEEEIFAALGLAFVPPELREDLGEIEAAEKDALPRHLVELGDLQGALHVYTQLSEGTATIEELARGARELGWKYLGISDRHSAGESSERLNAADLSRQRKEIERVGRKVSGLHLFHGIVVDILPDGQLDADEDFLAAFDFVIGAIHSELELDSETQTRRLLRALGHSRITLLAHPLGRILETRRGLHFDLGAVSEAAAKHAVALEIHSDPQRMDLDGMAAKQARDKGALVCINPGAGSVAELENVRYGIGLARRGWLEPHHVLNCMPLQKLREHLQARRKRKADA